MATLSGASSPIRNPYRCWRFRSSSFCRSTGLVLNSSSVRWIACRTAVHVLELLDHGRDLEQRRVAVHGHLAAEHLDRLPAEHQLLVQIALRDRRPIRPAAGRPRSRGCPCRRRRPCRPASGSAASGRGRRRRPSAARSAAARSASSAAGSRAATDRSTFRSSRSVAGGSTSPTTSSTTFSGR